MTTPTAIQADAEGMKIESKVFHFFESTIESSLEQIIKRR